MSFTIYKNNSDPVPLLVEQLRAGRLQDHLVLVSTVHDKRLLQNELSRQFLGLAPKVEVLSHQLATWLKYGVDGAVGKLFLIPRERRFALSRWNVDWSMGYSDTELDRMHDILSWIGLHGLDSKELPSDFGGLERIFSQFTDWCTDKNWVDRTSMFLFANRVPSHAIDHKHIHLYQIGKPERHLTSALDAIIDGGGNEKNWIVYRPSANKTSTGLRIDQSDSAEEIQLEKVRVNALSALDVRDEVTTVFKVIKDRVAISSDGLSYDDFVLLVTDYDLYRPFLEHMSDSFDVPLSLSKGAKLLGDPAVSRLRALLNVQVNGFKLEDILDIYGDGIIPLTSDSAEENQLPNLRTFGRFCKQYNIRTIDQLASELARAMEREVRNRIQGAIRKGAIVDHDPTFFIERHGEFYQDICKTLVGLKSRYPNESQPMSSWFMWTKEMIVSLGVLSSAELMAAAGKLSKAAELGLTMVSRIEHDPIMDGAEFSRAFDELLDGNIPVSQHPGRVMAGAVGDYTCFPRKHVFVLGMTESSFPQTIGSEDLFAFMGSEGATWVRKLENDPYEVAVCSLASLSNQAGSLCLSYANSGDSDHTMPSVFISDSKTFFPWWDVQELPVPSTSNCFDKLDWMKRHSNLPFDPEVDTLHSTDIGNLSSHVSAVARLRESPIRISIWDGMLPSARGDSATVADEVIQKAVSSLKKDGALRISVSQLDSFVASPLDYFFSRLLRIEPPTEYLDEAEQNKKGTLLHTILDLFYSDTSAFGDIVDPVRNEDAALIRIKKIAEKVFEDHVEDLGNPETPFPAILKNQIGTTLEAFIKVEHSGLTQVEGIWGEVRPATLRDKNARVTEVPFLYELDVDGITVQINGFIDRIDTNADESIKIIYDYKTGSDYSVKYFKDMNAGLSFQLPVYLNSLKGDEVSRMLAGYYHIPLSKKGKKIKLKGMLGNRSLTVVKDGEMRYKDNHGLLPDEQLSQFLEALQENRIKPIVRLILSGSFHQSLTEPSKYSDFKRMSRWSKAVNELRKLTIKSVYSEADIFSHYYVEATVYKGPTVADIAEGED
jgi:hypothetical protein